MPLAGDIQNRIEAAVASLDRRALDALLRELYEAAPQGENPFDAAIRLRPEVAGELGGLAAESDAALTWANRIARASRLVAYRFKISAGFDGLRIVEEGDSWFQYPLRLDDTIDQLSRDADKAVFSLSGAGDLLRDMASRRDYVGPLQETGARVMLLSGGGNDMLGGGRFANFLLPYAQGKQGAELLNLPMLRSELDSAADAYRRILADVGTQFPEVRVFGHGYDVAHPKKNGPWIGAPLATRGIPLDVGRTVVAAVLDLFAERLVALQDEFPHFRFVNLRGKVDAGPQSWFDELHPKDAGYGRVAEAFRAAIAEEEAARRTGSGTAAGGRARAQRAGAPGVGGAPESGAPESGVPESHIPVIVLDPGHGGAPPPSKVGGSSWNNATGPQGALEKTLTLDIAVRAQAILENRGLRALLTRTGDVNLSLAGRAGVARSNAADVFVSIHFNASTGHDAQGTETFVHTSHAEASRRLCVAVQREMVRELGLRDRNAGHPGGVKVGAFGVIAKASHAAQTAAVLHEVSFLDRVDEEQKLQTDAYRDRIAGALARGVEAYLGAGAEPESAAAEADGVGDAIELGAMASGMSVTAYLGGAEARGAPAPGPGQTAGWRGGHELPAEIEGGAAGGGDFHLRIAESLQRDGLAAASAYANDVHEFEEIGPGRAFDASRFGFGVEADSAALAPLFAGVESAGFDMDRFEAFIRGLGLRHFRAAEFLFLGSGNAPGGRCGGRNGLPPKALWPNIARTARMLDAIRVRLGARIDILSCYRNADYNACVGGERNSLHTEFNAVDWTCAAGSVEQWHRVATDLRRSNPEFAGGVGRYDRRGFVHVDTRGVVADWVG